MKKQAQKQSEEQQQSGGNIKLERSKYERGEKELNSKIKSYFAILSNGKVEDYDATSPIFARQYFNNLADALGLQVKSVRAYQ